MPSNYTRRISLYINGKEVKNEVASIRAEMNKLVSQQARMTIGSKEYVRAGKSIRELKAVLQEHNNNLKSTASGWDRMKRAAEGMNRYFLMISSAVAGLGGLVMAGKKAISMFAKFDDQVADVKRTTGMTRDEIYAMNESLKKVNTRTAQLDLMKLGEIAGKLGIPKLEVEGFIRSADKISVALSGALGTDTEEAINQIGKLVDIFKIKDRFGIEDSMLKVGSALNSLGNASTANEGYIVEFTKRVGGIAPTVGVSIQSVMGLAATLDQLGQTSEVSSTVYSAMITGMFKKTGEYAKIAGLDVKKFKDLLGKDTNEAFIKVLEGLKGTNGGMERLVELMGDIGMDGKRSASVLGVLSNNTQLLREQQDISNGSFKQGTSILDAFNSKNNSAQAILDKARKRMDNLAVTLGEKLLPVLTLSTNGFSYFVKYVGILVDFTIRHSTAILTAGVAIAAYTVASKAASVIESIRLATSKQSILLAQIETNWIRLKILLTNEATMAQKRALVANKALGASMTATPWGAIAAAIVLVTMAVIGLVKHFGKASAAQEALNEARKRSTELVVDEKSKVDLLVSLINSENVSMASKKKAIEDLKRIIPGYTAMLNDQGKVIYQNTESVKDYITQLRRQYMLQGYQEQFGKANMALATARDERDTYVMGLKGGRPRTMYQRVKLDSYDKEIEDQQSIVIALQSKVEDSLNAQNDFSARIQKEAEMMIKINASIKASTNKDVKEALQAELIKHTEAYIGYINASKGITPAGIAAAAGEGGTGGGGTGSGFSGEIEVVKDALQELSKKVGEYDTLINNAIVGGNTPLAEKLQIEKTAAENLLETYNQLKKALAEGKDIDILQFIGPEYKNPNALVAKGAGTIPLGQPGASPLQPRETTTGGAPPPDPGEDYSEAILDATLQATQDINDAIFDIVKNRRQAEFEHALSLLDKQREAELANKNLTEAQKDKINAKYKQKSDALRLKQFHQDQKLAVVMAIINGSLAAIKAFATLGPVMGAIAAAGIAIKTIAEIAVIKKQKPPEYYEGGFTAKASSNKKPAGIVHANEYVVPEQGVNNPGLQPLLGMIEVARQNGSLPTLNTRTILKSLGTGFRDGGATSEGVLSGKKTGLSSGSFADITELLAANTNVMNLLLIRLEEPISVEATVAIRGRNGLYEKLEEDKQSQNNASL